MAEHSLTAPTQTAFQRYAPSLFSFAVLVIGSLQTVTTINLVVALQLVALAAGSAATLLVPLVGTTYRGKVKIALEILTALIALVLPYAIAGGITREQGILVIVGALKILATHFGLAIRTDPRVAPVSATGVFDVSTLPAATVSYSVADLASQSIASRDVVPDTVGVDPLPEDPELDSSPSVEDIVARSNEAAATA